MRWTIAWTGKKYNGLTRALWAQKVPADVSLIQNWDFEKLSFIDQVKKLLCQSSVELL
jgi:hypothetical protein